MGKRRGTPIFILTPWHLLNPAHSPERLSTEQPAWCDLQNVLSYAQRGQKAPLFRKPHLCNLQCLWTWDVLPFLGVKWAQGPWLHRNNSPFQELCRGEHAYETQGSRLWAQVVRMGSAWQAVVAKPGHFISSKITHHCSFCTMAAPLLQELACYQYITIKTCITLECTYPLGRA